MGFTFSFPVDQTGLAEGTLVEWTKVRVRVTEQGSFRSQSVYTIG